MSAAPATADGPAPDETITRLRNRLDFDAGRRDLADRPAEIRDGGIQRILGDESALPAALGQHIAADDVPPGIGKGKQQEHDPRRHGDRVARPLKLPDRRKHDEIAQLERRAFRQVGGGG